MKLIVVDIQGFNLPEFYPKEISFINGQQQTHYLLQPPFPYAELSFDIRKQVKYLENHHHGLKYSSGYVSYDVLDDILNDYILNGEVDMVYVKGHQKQEFLEKKLLELSAENSSAVPSVINVEHINTCIDEPPKFVKDIPYCLNHYPNCKYMCSLRNSLKLYNWLHSNLPK